MRSFIVVLLAILAAACSPIPVQVSSTRSSAESSAEAAANAELAATLKHQAETKLGTQSTPVTVICIQNNMGSVRDSSCLKGQHEAGTIERIIDPTRKRK